MCYVLTNEHVTFQFEKKNPIIILTQHPHTNRLIMLHFTTGLLNFKMNQ